MATVSAAAPRVPSLREWGRILAHRAGQSIPGKTRVARTLLLEFASFAGPRWISLTAVLILAGTAVEGVGILLIVPLLQLVIEPGTEGAWADVVPFDWLLAALAPSAQYVALFAGFGFLLLVRALILVGRDTQVARLQWGFIEVIKLGLFRRLAGAPWRDVMAIERPRLNRALGSDMVQVSLAVNAAMQSAAAALAVAGYCAFAFVLAPGLSVLTCGILAAVGMAGAIFVRRAGAFGRATLGYDLRMEESASHYLAGLKLAKAQDLQAGFVASYAEASRASVTTRIAFVRTMSMSRQLATLFGAAAASAAVLNAVLAADADPAVLLTFVVLLSRTAAPLAQMQQGLQQVANALPVYAELHELGGHIAQCASEQTSRCAGPSAPRAISFCGAELTHRMANGESQGGVRAVELDIAPGEFLGLAGPTGSGKSTLLDLAAGLEMPDAGRVLFGGRELSDVDLAAHRGALAYLAADPALFGGTVRSNLSWAAPHADDEAMWTAIEAAIATELVDRLGGGLDSRIHEAGANLSAGERQQIAIARALLRRPSLLLLDEATSSLDIVREQRVLSALASLDPRPTILFVSHREESFARCDRVVGLSEGQITSVRRVA